MSGFTTAPLFLANIVERNEENENLGRNSHSVRKTALFDFLPTSICHPELVFRVFELCSMNSWHLHFVSAFSYVSNL